MQAVFAVVTCGNQFVDSALALARATVTLVEGNHAVGRQGSHRRTSITQDLEISA